MYLAEYEEGCEGFAYKFKFDTAVSDNDFVVVENEQKVTFAMGDEEMKLMRGSTIDYATEMMREMFIVK